MLQASIGWINAAYETFHDKALYLAGAIAYKLKQCSTQHETKNQRTVT